ncbi:MAG: DUF418 domain-containing protein [Arenimonas sp.]|uniref:DUF418 domain-containing protein n=1 Tax=Arenimonas sp. TaxID=1872635 RepID=UPI0025B84125|nr:DUF418 domain-containing protein [Arenimonas sp.]MBW8368596.1 DUF418 domain-containing protein [Arenimonas sp.]
MSDAARISPVPAQERLVLLDVLRGFALLGIFLMNIEGIVAPFETAVTGIDPSHTGIHYWVDALVYVLVQAKFYPLFSMLFGMGFALMMARAADAGRPFAGLYLRRTLALLVFGLLHLAFVWTGDILNTYALLAFAMLLLFRETPVSRLPKWGVGLMLVPPLMLVLGGAAMSLAAGIPEVAAQIAKSEAESRAGLAAYLQDQQLAYGSGTFMEATHQRLLAMPTALGALLIYGWQILGLFLLGSWFVRSGAMARPLDFARLFWRLRWVALPIGLAITLASVLLKPTLDLATMDLRQGSAMALQMMGGTLMCLGYLAWIVRAMDSAKAAARLAWLAPAGRMALTNYLAQSVVSVYVFYGYGLGYFGQLPRAGQVLYVLAFFVVQVLLSRAWLARYRFGPMEWLWRALTYLQLPPMRRG